MKFLEPVRQGEFVKRYKRFFAEVRLGPDEVIVAHVANTGTLKSCLFADAACVITESSNPARKLKATLHFIKTPTSWVGVNTSLPNALVYEAWELGRLWPEFRHAVREHKISKESRLDLALGLSPEQPEIQHYVEVKNVTYAEGDVALFPDAVTTRGQKHLLDLMKLNEQGFGAELLFVVQRQDCRYFAPADTIDAEYGKLLRQAHKQGVVIRALSCTIDPESGVTLGTESLELRW